jgi:hypothetical protein
MAVPNLDTMGPWNLHEFAVKHEEGRNYRELFPEGGKAIWRDTRLLANIAFCKYGHNTMKDSDPVQARLFKELEGGFYAKLTPAAQWRRK